MSALDHPEVELSLEHFLERTRPRLKSLFSRYRIPPEDTEDILQESLLALIYQWQKIRDPEAWLFGTLRNRCLIYWRDRRHKLYDSVDTAVLDWIANPTPPEQEGEDLARDLTTVIDRLPDRCRSLLKLRYRLGYEPPEVAERLGYRPASIGKVTTRCLAALLRQLTISGLFKKG